MAQGKQTLWSELQRITTENTDIVSIYHHLLAWLDAFISRDLSADNLCTGRWARLNNYCRIKQFPPAYVQELNDWCLRAEQYVAGQMPDGGNLPKDILCLSKLSNIPADFTGTEDAEAASAPSEKLPSVFRAIVLSIETNHFRVRPLLPGFGNMAIYANDTEQPMRFQHTLSLLWPGCQVNLLHTQVKGDDSYAAETIILEPDYLIDASALAECLKEYGAHPLHYLKNKLEPRRNTKYILLGNAANLFLDECVNAPDLASLDYRATLKKMFAIAPFELATCADLKQKTNEADFFLATQLQFENIRRTVAEDFPEKDIQRNNSMLEPSFMCAQIGMQGRLDFLQLGKHPVVIELKSGKAPYPEGNTSLIGINHRTQAAVYQAMLHHILGLDGDSIATYIFYSRYGKKGANLRRIPYNQEWINKILDIRNRIVANEYAIATDATDSVIAQQMKAMEPETFIQNETCSKQFLDKYIRPQIKAFQQCWIQASSLEQLYFNSFYTFIAREQYISKAGTPAGEGLRGLSSLWLSTLTEKREAGEILTGLQITQNDCDAAQPRLELLIPETDEARLSNFRAGDITVLYQWAGPQDNVTNRQVFRGIIAQISDHQITICLRSRQHNKSLLPENARYAIEHDFMDAGFATMYRGLYVFLQADKDRRDLILDQRPLRFEENRKLNGHYPNREIADIVLKAKQAKDIFLLVGPPGTGKTSIALKSMVEEFLTEKETGILLLSYTNRAVDEICEALDHISPTVDYIRIGSSFSCAPAYHPHLLDQLLTNCKDRAGVREIIAKQRIFVGTVSSLSGKPELFQLKHFDVAIIDEASQILEPHLLALMAAQDARHNPAIGKFIFIGDHKQLPAVVLQSSEASAVKHPPLQAIGLTNRRNSLFERLFSLHKNNPRAHAMLRWQGRMHPAIAAFPSRFFYNNALQPVPLAHQQGALKYIRFDSHDPWQQKIVHQRVCFFSTTHKTTERNIKSNREEAGIAVHLVEAVYGLFRENGLYFNPRASIGIITPYRNQIALIKQLLAESPIPDNDKIMVDTVERYQGSQKDIIIYSFCVNERYQLQQLSNQVTADGQVVDRKLNVALTRARKQLFLIGNRELLEENKLYAELLDFIENE